MSSASAAAHVDGRGPSGWLRPLGQERCGGRKLRETGRGRVPAAGVVEAASAGACSSPAAAPPRPGLTPGFLVELGL